MKKLELLDLGSGVMWKEWKILGNQKTVFIRKHSVLEVEVGCVDVELIQLRMI